MMELSTVPNFLRIILLLLSILSFLPQIRLIISRNNSSGVSLTYLLFNLISTTEQFTLAFCYTISIGGQSDFFTHRPLNAGDWLNFAQTAVVACLWLILFITTLRSPSDHSRTSKRAAVAVYTAFLLISIIPLLADLINPGYKHDRSMYLAIFHGFHSVYLSCPITALNALSLYFQARETLSRPPSQALSLTGLAFQAVVFALVAVLWIGRVAFPYGDLEGRFIWAPFLAWYELVGWVAVDNAVFAVVQAILWGITKRHKESESRDLEGEIEPLLHARIFALHNSL